MDRIENLTLNPHIEACPGGLPPESRLFAVGIRICAQDPRRLGNEPVVPRLDGGDWFGWIALAPADFSLAARAVESVPLPEGFRRDGKDAELSAFFCRKLPIASAPEMSADPSSGMFAQEGDWTPSAALWALDVCSEREVPKVWSDEWYAKLLSDARPYAQGVDAALRKELPAVQGLGLRDVCGQWHWQSRLLAGAPALLGAWERAALDAGCPKPGRRDKAPGKRV